MLAVASASPVWAATMSPHPRGPRMPANGPPFQLHYTPSKPSKPSEQLVFESPQRNLPRSYLQPFATCKPSSLSLVHQARKHANRHRPGKMQVSITRHGFGSQVPSKPGHGHSKRADCQRAERANLNHEGTGVEGCREEAGRQLFAG